MNYVKDPGKKIPVFCEADVGVLGGGSAGTLAALASARQGAQTVLVERMGTVGGVATTDLMASMNNRFFDHAGHRLLGGITRELIDRVAAAGGTRFPDGETALRGDQEHPPRNFQFSPEIMSTVQLQMLKEAGVKVMLHTHFSHILGKSPRPRGFVVVNKSGQGAVLAKAMVDASGDADLAAAAGAPCQQPETSWGLLMRIGNVDFDRVMGLLSELKPWEPWPEFTTWLSGRLGQPVEDLEKDRYWRYLLDPLEIGGAPKENPDDNECTPKRLRWMQERWKREGIFYTFEMSLFRHLIKDAVEAGDIDLVKRIEGFGELRLNWDGIAMGAWGPGIALINSCHGMSGFDGTDGDHVSRAEMEGRIYCTEIAGFYKKYVPGFAESYLLDMGWQFVPRAARMIEGELEYASEQEFEASGAEVPDPIFITAPGGDLYGSPKQMSYRVLVPKKVDNILVAGKCASSAVIFRTTGCCMAMGEAAGTAARLMVETGESNRNLDPVGLGSKLRKQGTILDLPE